MNEKDITLFNTTIFLLSDIESSSEMKKYVMPIAKSVKDICILVSQDNILTSILTHVVHMVHRNGNYIYILNTKSGVRLSNNLRILNIGHSLIHTFDDEKSILTIPFEILDTLDEIEIIINGSIVK